MVLHSLKSSICIYSFIKVGSRNKVKFVNLCDINKLCQKAFKCSIRCLRVQFEEKSPVIMQLSTPKFQSILTDDVKYLRNLFEENGFEIRIAGGAVRDLLLGNIPNDIDLATTATPDEMKDMFNKLEIRLINRRGENHGTITPRINDINYEITSLRVDEVTNGRHAMVKFTTNWFKDASRRDLTINAMFLDMDGKVHDYFNGIEDLKNRRVAFVGDASTRIQEDYLRILRYFRFYGRISEKPDNHEEETLSAIKENVEGLRMISGERIWDELNKILTGNYAMELLKTMVNLGVGPYIGLPSKCNLDELERVSQNLKNSNLVLDPITILCTLLHTREDVESLILRIKPSGECREIAYFIVEERNKGIPERPLKYYQKQLILSKKQKSIKAGILQYLAYIGDEQTLKEFEKFTGQIPINGQTVKNAGITNPQQVGFVIKELQIMWIDSDCTLTKEQLIEKIPEAAAKYVIGPPESLKKRKRN